MDRNENIRDIVLTQQPSTLTPGYVNDSPGMVQNVESKYSPKVKLHKNFNQIISEENESEMPGQVITTQTIIPSKSIGHDSENLVLIPQDVLIFNNIAEKEATGTAGTEDQPNTADLRNSGTKTLQNAAALPPLQIGREQEEIDQSPIRTSKMADRSNNSNNNSNLVLNSKLEFDQRHQGNSHLKQSTEAVRDQQSHQKSNQKKNLQSALVRGANSKQELNLKSFDSNNLLTHSATNKNVTMNDYAQQPGQNFFKGISSERNLQSRGYQTRQITATAREKGESRGVRSSGFNSLLGTIAKGENLRKHSSKNVFNKQDSRSTEKHQANYLMPISVETTVSPKADEIRVSGQDVKSSKQNNSRTHRNDKTRDKFGLSDEMVPLNVGRLIPQKPQSTIPKHLQYSQRKTLVQGTVDSTTIGETTKREGNQESSAKMEPTTINTTTRRDLHTGRTDLQASNATFGTITSPFNNQQSVPQNGFYKSDNTTVKTSAATGVKDSTARIVASANSLKIPDLTLPDLKINMECFDSKIPRNQIDEICSKLEAISSNEKLQVILLKLWDLGKYVRYNTIVQHFMPMAVRRSMKKMNHQKIGYLQAQLEESQNVPLRTLTIPEFQILLSKITLAMYIILESSLNINQRIINFEKYEKKQIEEISFADFKLYIIALFGQNLFTVSSDDIDTILRKVHKELVVYSNEEELIPQLKSSSVKDDKNKQFESNYDPNLKIGVESLKNMKKLLAQKKIVPTKDLIKHIFVLKFNDASKVQKHKMRKELVHVMNKIYSQADITCEEEDFIDEMKQKNVSKVREHIAQIPKANHDPDKTIKPSEYTYIVDANGKKTIDIWTKTKVIWKNIDSEKRILYKANPFKSKSSEKIFQSNSQLRNNGSSKQNLDYADQQQQSAFANVQISKSQSSNVVNKLSQNPQNLQQNLIHPQIQSKIITYDFNPKPVELSKSNITKPMNLKHGDTTLNLETEQDQYNQNQPAAASKTVMQQFNMQQTASELKDYANNLQNSRRTLPSARESAPVFMNANTSLSREKQIFSARSNRNYVTAGGERRVFTALQPKRLASARQDLKKKCGFMVPSLYNKDDSNQNIPNINKPPTGLVSHMINKKQTSRNEVRQLMNTERVDRIEPIQKAKDPTKHNTSFPIRSFVQQRMQKLNHEKLVSSTSNDAKIESLLQRNFYQTANVQQSLVEEGKIMQNSIGCATMKKASTRQYELALDNKKLRFKNTMNEIKSHLEKQSGNQFIEQLSQRQNQETNQFKTLASTLGLNTVFEGRQCDEEQAYTLEELEAGMVPSNLTNYKQIIQQVSENYKKKTAQNNKLVKPLTGRVRNMDYHLEDKYRHFDKKYSEHQHQYITSQFPENWRPLKEPLANKERFSTCEDHERSRELQVINYLVPDHLQSKFDQAQVISNSSINNPETLKFYKILNKNEVIREVDSNIPRFGLHGRQQAPLSAVARPPPPVVSHPDELPPKFVREQRLSAMKRLTEKVSSLKAQQRNYKSDYYKSLNSLVLNGTKRQSQIGEPSEHEQTMHYHNKIASPPTKSTYTTLLQKDLETEVISIQQSGINDTIQTTTLNAKQPFDQVENNIHSNGHRQSLSSVSRVTVASRLNEAQHQSVENTGLSSKFHSKTNSMSIKPNLVISSGTGIDGAAGATPEIQTAVLVLQAGNSCGNESR